MQMAAPAATCLRHSSTLSLDGPHTGSEPSGRGLTAYPVDQGPGGLAGPHNGLVAQVHDRNPRTSGKGMVAGHADEAWLGSHDLQVKAGGVHG